jgi:hypothetical protein
MTTPNVTYDSTRTYLVENRKDSYLFRGNEPLKSDGTFAYDDMMSRFKKLAGEDLTNHKLIDISLIDCTAEFTDLNCEFVAFGQDFNKLFPTPNWPPYFNGFDVKKEYGSTVNKKSGSLIWYPVQGCTDNDNCNLVENPQFAFSELVDFLNELLNRSKVCIYYHCEHGHDRTSALSAAYMMKYMKVSKNDALTLSPPKGAKSFSHPWEVNYKALAEWYAGTIKK